MTLPNCRLFLVVPTGRDLRAVEDAAAAALEAGDVASLLVSSGSDQKELVDALQPIVRRYDVAFLVEDDYRLARAAGADGVQVEASPSGLAAARAALGERAVVGARCGPSRHDAMTIAEAGADYVAFTGIDVPVGGESILEWWNELFEVPSVAFEPLAEDAARRAVALGADFIRPPESMWQSPETAAATVISWNSLIEDSPRC
jgi:thiamine-phosphate pyrophosphorylase